MKIPSSEITPEQVYLSRRRVLKIGALAVGSLAGSACQTATPGAPAQPASAPPTTQSVLPTPQANQLTDELGDPLTAYDAITSYNNFYEFTPIKTEVAKLARNLVVSPWQVEVGGLVRHPKTYDLDDLRRRFPEQERVYRLRCVEGWSMVIPWLGFPLRSLLNEVEPLPTANHVRFEALLAPDQMPRQRDSFYRWPYVEGLALKEALHDLTFLATGLYGHSLPPQNGAPLRLVVPWKYGFKSIKSIVRIELVNQEPATFWATAVPQEYGYYANVNPAVPHPRWSQATERRIGELVRRRTLMFNGYAEQVAHLYDGLDLIERF